MVVQKKIQEMPTWYLFNCLKSIYDNINKNILNCNMSNPRNVYKEIFKRIITPFYLPLLILIVSLNFLISKESVKYTKHRLVIFLLGLFTIVLSESSLGYIQKNVINN